MFSKFCDWRFEGSVDTLLQEFDFHEEEGVMASYQRQYFGSCKDGKPFFVDRSGAMDLKSALAAIGGQQNIERMWSRYAQDYETTNKLRFLASSVVFGRQIDKTRTIVDMKGFSVAKLWSKQVKGFLKHVTSLGQNYYPEMMGHMMIVNAPMAFTAVWAVVKGWVDEKTREKVNIYGGPKKYLKKLELHVDIKQIPVCLGGENEQSWLSDVGPWNDFELVDSAKPGAVVGVRRKDDPTGKIWTGEDIIKLPNPAIKDKNGGVMGTFGAVTLGPDGKYIPYEAGAAGVAEQMAQLELQESEQVDDPADEELEPDNEEEKE